MCGRHRRTTAEEEIARQYHSASHNQMRLFFARGTADQIPRVYAARVVLFFVLAVIVAGLLFLICQFTQTLYQLHITEGERDRWQQPERCNRFLGIESGQYCSRRRLWSGILLPEKLAPKVAEQGTVLAEDILDESLAVLWIRAALSGQSNVRVVHGDLDDPRLPERSVDAVLIANSYHEFTRPLSILDHAFRALRPGGRLVVVDRGARFNQEEPREVQMGRYQIAASIVEHEVRQRGFGVVVRDDRFIDRPATERPGDRQDDHIWWLIVARKP
jgi:SAM-dependent methyltransferase